MCDGSYIDLPCHRFPLYGEGVSRYQGKLFSVPTGNREEYEGGVCIGHCSRIAEQFADWSSNWFFAVVYFTDF